MALINVQKRGVEALKLFNNSITTRRLYPPEAPQVSNAASLGFEGVQQYVADFGSLSFSLERNASFVADHELSPEILDSFPNLVVYRHLRHLGYSAIVIDETVDRFTYNQIVDAFSVTAEKIARQGGGTQLITNMGLRKYFQQSDDNLGGAAKAQSDLAAHAKKKVVVRPELIGCLLGEDERPLVQEELKEKMRSVQGATEVVVAAVSYVLQSIHQQKRIYPSRLFSKMIENSGMMIDQAMVDKVAGSLGNDLSANLKNTALCVVLCQNFPGNFGLQLYNSLISRLTFDRFGRVVGILRIQLERLKIGGEQEAQRVVLQRVLERLFETDRGKQYQKREKTRHIIDDGERERRKKRLEVQLGSLVGGNLQSLESIELLRHLPRAVSKLLKGENRAYVPKILKYLVSYYYQNKNRNLLPWLECVFELTEKIMESGNQKLLNPLAEILRDSAQSAAFGEELFEKNIIILQEVMYSYWKKEEFRQGDAILALLYQLRAGQIKNAVGYRKVVANVQDNFIDRTILPNLLQQCLLDHTDESLIYRMVLQGPVAIRFMVDSLIEEELTENRIKIIDILTSVRTFVPVVVRERLKDHMPWYGKRNLIKLLGETGKEEDAQLTLPYLQHRDYRVQREAFLCIYKIGGRHRKRLLLAGLDGAPELVMINIVEALEEFCDDEVALKLGTILPDFMHISETEREQFLVTVMTTLGHCRCTAALDVLETFLDTKGQKTARSVPGHLWDMAEEKCDSLRTALKEETKAGVKAASRIRKSALRQAAAVGRDGRASALFGPSIEKTVQELVAGGENEQAQNLLLELIAVNVDKKNFNRAEKIREWLVEIDESALVLIMRAVELIEQGKREADREDHLEVWSKLYDALDTEEFCELFGAMIHRKYDPGQRIVTQGTSMKSFVFIDKGRANVSFDLNGEEVLLTTVERGGCLGAETRLEPSNWTISATSVGACRVSVLPFERVAQWEESCPRLIDKIKQFCADFRSTGTMIEENSLDRRAHERFAADGKVRAMLLDSRDRRTGGQIIGDIKDISAGGMAFEIVAKHNKEGKTLWGARMLFQFLDVSFESSTAEVAGDVIAVKFIPGAADGEELLSVHVRFDAVLHADILERIQDVRV
ncbi:Cyclic nucleotide-binding domain-containing protein [Desulforhopalus singaporensis]|uniref:Cyclic nucleotide-binding domain-containing protein n=2 Tax=Desulforhopalus singaporensis TaxID=91360 RepID=A0A1H0J8G0_9BACT|nr:Cyclic nucleotide-binding domain-containing protein [Desulforhopalus singaporensis]